MRKLAYFFILLILLSGCVAQETLFTRLDRVFNNAETLENYHMNNNMKYYSYYLPSDMGEEVLDSDSVVVKFNDSRIIMNLNISSIINSKYYKDAALADDGFFVKDYLVYNRSGKYNTDGIKKDYVFNLYKYDSYYVLHLYTNDMNYYGTIYASDLCEGVRQLMIVAKNTSVNAEEVIKQYSKKDVIDYQKKQISLFDMAVPISGELSSMLIEGAVVGDGSVN